MAGMRLAGEVEGVEHAWKGLLYYLEVLGAAVGFSIEDAPPSLQLTAWSGDESSSSHERRGANEPVAITAVTCAIPFNTNIAGSPSREASLMAASEAAITIE